jgi:hypothetical protein
LCFICISFGPFAGGGFSMLVHLSSFAIGTVFGWQLMRPRGVALSLQGLRLAGAAGVLILLTVFGTGHPLLALAGLTVGVAGHACLIAHLQQKEKI